MSQTESFDPPEFPEKVKFLIHGHHPSKRLGHKPGNQSQFAKLLGTPRETLRDQVFDRRVLPTDTQTKLAEKLGFRVDWPEWSSGSASDFKNRYVKDVPLSPQPTRSARRTALISGGGAAALLLAFLVSLWVRPAPAPYISQVRLFDESKSAIIPGSDANGANPQHTLTALDARSSNNFEIKSAEKFFFAMGFVLNHLSVGKNGAMKVKFSVDGLSTDGVAWSEPAEYQYEDRWKEFDIAKSLGPDAVHRAFNLEEGGGLPIAVVIECKKWEELSKWNGAIRVSVQDLNTGKDDQVSLQYLVNLAEPAMQGNGVKECVAP